MNKQNMNNGTSNSFTNLLLDYYEQYEHDPKSEEFTNTLTTIAKIITHSVLRKCIDVSHNESLIEVKRDIVKDSNSLETIARANRELYSLSYTEDGDLVSKLVKEEYVIRKDSKGKDKKVKKENSLEVGYNREVRERLGDGLDLVNVAIITLLEQTREHGAYLDMPYTIRRLKRKVYIKLEDSVKGWEEVETTPIQETFKAVRRAIENSRAIATDPRNGYSYLEDIATDSETGEETTVYRRLDKYSDLGGNMSEKHAELSDPLTIICNSESYGTMSHGTMYSANANMVNKMDELIESLNLSMRESQVLKLRLRGYGNKAIATYLGVSLSSVKTIQRRVKEKAIASEVFKTELIDRYTKE